jgi:acetylornithine deacetylase/succinyl-diaminopimelate desuccinylase-like protein
VRRTVAGEETGKPGRPGRSAIAAILTAALLGILPTTFQERGRAAEPPAAGAPLIGGDEIVRLLRDYLRIDTSNPPGNEILAARFFKGLFDAEGIPSEIFEFAPGRADIVARLKGNGSKKALILSNHMDVVNVERPYWTVDPFAGEIKDGFVYGRGTLDMKTTGLLEAITFINVKRSGGMPSRDLVFVGTGDEEVAAAGIEWLVRERPDLVRDAEYLINEGGNIDEVGGKPRSYNVSVTEKVPAWLKITAKGRPGHGSQPFVKDNAVLELLAALGRLSRYETPIRITPAAEGYFIALAASEPPARAAKFRSLKASLRDPAFRASILGDPVYNAILRDTIAITMLQGAPQTNIIPTVAEARVDVRLLPGKEPEEFLQEIRKVIDTPGVTVEPAGRAIPATASPVDSDLVRAIDRARARHHPEAILAPTILTGWTESATMRTLGIKAYGFEPYLLDESEQQRAHGNDERISVQNVLAGAEIFDEVVRDLCR